MDNKLRQLIDENSLKFSDWIAIINTHTDAHFSDKQYTQEELSEITFKVAKVLSDISEMFFKYGAFKDKFDNSKMYLNVYGLSLIIKSEKTDTTFYLGVDENGIYLNTFLKHPENIRHMDDTFYKDILTLNDFGKFKLEENEFYGKQTTSKYPDLFSNQKSTIFKLLRNYLIGTIEEEHSILLGQFQVLWTYDKGFSNTVANGCLAFKTLYKLNYALWKVHDLMTKKK